MENEVSVQRSCTFTMEEKRESVAGFLHNRAGTSIWPL